MCWGSFIAGVLASWAVIGLVVWLIYKATYNSGPRF